MKNYVKSVLFLQLLQPISFVKSSVQFCALVDFSLLNRRDDIIIGRLAIRPYATLTRGYFINNRTPAPQCIASFSTFPISESTRSLILLTEVVIQLLFFSLKATIFLCIIYIPSPIRSLCLDLSLFSYPTPLVLVALCTGHVNLI